MSERVFARGPEKPSVRVRDSTCGGGAKRYPMSRNKDILYQGASASLATDGDY